MLILAITVMFDINEKLDAFLKAPLKATVFELPALLCQSVQSAIHFYRGDFLHFQAGRQFRDHSHVVDRNEL